MSQHDDTGSGTGGHGARRGPGGKGSISESVILVAQADSERNRHTSPSSTVTSEPEI